MAIQGSTTIEGSGGGQLWDDGFGTLSWYLHPSALVVCKVPGPPGPFTGPGNLVRVLMYTSLQQMWKQILVKSQGFYCVV